MWTISWSVLVTMTERDRERMRKGAGGRKSLFKKDLSAGTVVNICEISEVKIFLEFSHLRRRKKKRGRDSQQQVPSLGLDSSYYTQLLLENYTICTFG